MSILFRKPLVYLLIASILVISIGALSLSGVLKWSISNPNAPSFSQETSLAPGRVQLLQDATLKVVIRNYAPTLQRVSFVLNTTSPLVTFHFSNGSSLRTTKQVGQYYVTSYPGIVSLGRDESWTVTLLAKGDLQADSSGRTYSVVLMLYADTQKADEKTFFLEVYRS